MHVGDHFYYIVCVPKVIDCVMDCWSLAMVILPSALDTFSVARRLPHLPNHQSIGSFVHLLCIWCLLALW